jgi:hypothetical protein
MDCLKNININTRSSNQILFQKSDRPMADKGCWKHWSRTDDVIDLAKRSAISAKRKFKFEFKN